MTPQILLYNITDEDRKKKIKALLLRLRIRACIVEKNRYHEPIGCLAGMDISETAQAVQSESERNEAGNTQDFSDEMLIFCFLPDAVLNQMLQGLRKAGVIIPLKAVLTPSNCTWNSYMIHREIAAEHEMMHRKQE